MQLDMHYYGTYAMARAAGLARDAATMIATCAQFVDDNVADVDLEFGDGSRIDAEATAHHALDKENLEAHDQRQVWVPFHFLPGNEGASYTARLKCRMDSEIAREMRSHHLALAEKPYAEVLMGIAAHVYADTFSHYGFSGISSRGNRVDNGSIRFQDLDPEVETYITKKAGSFFERRGKHRNLFPNFRKRVREKAEKLSGAAAEALSGALGHGSVATYPDRPYLAWSFDYESEDATEGLHSNRNNQQTFLAGCRALHDMFRQFADLRADDLRTGDGRDFDAIESNVAPVLAVQGAKQVRIDAWQAAAGDGSVFGSGGERIPDYEGQKWNERWDALDGQESYQAAAAEPVWQFYQAASLHRTYVLRELLPGHGLIVD